MTPATLSFEPLRHRLTDGTYSDAQQAWLWHEALSLVEAAGGPGSGAPGQTPGRSLLAWLRANARQLAATEEAMRRLIYRKRNAWLAGGKTPQALMDRRTEANAQRRTEISQEDRNQIVASAVLNHGGRLATAFWELMQQGQLSQNLRSRFIANPADKGDLPRSVARELRPEVDMLRNIHLGPRTHRLNGAYIDRDWSTVAAGDWLCSDDVTCPVPYGLPDGSLTQGQLLLTIDVRSRRIQDFALLDSPNYNAFAIFSSYVRIFDRYGLPRKGMLWEMGIWKRSRLLKGGDSCPHSTAEVELGFQSLGLRFIHSVLPRSKPVENVIGLLQNLMEGEPGYSGRCQMLEKHERWQAARRDVESRRKTPAEAGFYSAAEWFQRLHELAEQYNRTPQQGILAGATPNEAWESYQRADDPPVALTGSIRYLLATHKLPVKVQNNGIVFQFGKQRFVYRNEATGRLIGRRLLAWFDPDNADSLCVTDERRKNLICVPRARAIPAMEATPEEMSAAQASVSAHNAYAKVRYSEIKTAFIPRPRVTLPDPASDSLGRDMAAAKTAARQEQKTVATARRIATRAGLPAGLVQLAHDPERTKRVINYFMQDSP